MSTVTQFAAQALKYAGGEVTVNLRHSTTDIALSAVAPSQRAAPPTFIARARSAIADSIDHALQAGARAHQTLQTQLVHANPLAALALNSATFLTAKLRSTAAVQKAEAVPRALAASVGGYAEGLGQHAAAGTYEWLPPTLRGVLTHPQLADGLSHATLGASTGFTDVVRELQQSHIQLSAALHTLVTNPLGVAQHAYGTYQSNVLNNPLETSQDVFRGVKTIADAALMLGPARALNAPRPMGAAAAAAQADTPRGRTIDLAREEYSVRYGNFEPELSIERPVVAAQDKAHLPSLFLKPSQRNALEPGFQFTEMVAREVPRIRLQADGAKEIYLELNVGKEIKVFAVGRPLEHQELILGDNNRYLVWDVRQGLRVAEGLYHFMRFGNEQEPVTILDRAEPTVDQLDKYFAIGHEATEIGTLRFSAGSISKSYVKDGLVQWPVLRGPATHPHPEWGGWYSLEHGFFPNRSPGLGPEATVDELLNAREVQVPGRDAVKVDREIQDDELRRLSLNLGDVEAHSIWADGDFYLLSGNFRAAPSLRYKKYQRIFSSSHNHPGGTLTSSLGDRSMVEVFYLHTLKSFPFERVRSKTRVVPNTVNDGVESMPFGPRRDVPPNIQTFNSSSLGLHAGPALDVHVRPRTPDKGIFRIEIGEDFSPSDGQKIRQRLLELAQEKKFKTVTFEVDLKGKEKTSEAFSDLILQLQGDRLVFSMQEPRYDFVEGTYPTADKIFVWHEDMANPSRRVSNAEAWGVK